VQRLTLAGWTVAAYTAIGVAIILAGATTGPVAAGAVALAPLGAVVASGAAVRALPGRAAAWLLIGGSGLIAALDAACSAFAGSGYNLPGAAAAQMLFAAAIALTVHQRDRGRSAEIALDTLLIACAATVTVLRWAPAAAGVPAGTAGMSLSSAVNAVLAPVAALCAIAFALVLLASLRHSRAGESAAAIAGAAILLGIGLIPLATGAAGGPFLLARVGGWALLTYTGVRVIRGGSELFLPADSDAGGARLRQAVAPTVALLIAVLIVDANARGPLNESIVLITALLGVTLALRVSRLLEATRDRLKEQRQLAQSRALVEVSHSLACATDLDDTLQRVTHWSCTLLNAHAAVIEMLTDDGTTLVVHAAEGFPREFMGTRFSVEQSFTGWVVRHAASRTTLDPSNEPDVQPESRPYLGRSPIAAAPLRYHETTLGVLTCVAQQPFDRAGLELLGALADQAAIAIQNARLFQQVNVLSKTDPLTGLANRRQLEHDLAREFSAAVRGRRLIAAMFDLNDFKDYNDRYGHLAGDEALRLFGEVLRAETRIMNFSARYGGDEFVALLADTDEEGARIFALRVQRSFAQRTVTLGRRPIGVSSGFAEYIPEMKRPEDLLAAADQELYRSKAKRFRAS
jgi:diguanylate cyclase (GGDEF)-like protein